MALGIIKPGQGYWMRVMTACLIGIVTLASAAWLADQAQLYIDKMEKTSFALSLRGIAGSAPAPGASITLIGRPDPAKPEQPIGKAEIVRLSVEDRNAVIRSVKMDEGFQLAQVSRVAAGDSAAPSLAAEVEGQKTPLPPIEPLYAQGGVAGVVIIIGTFLAFWLTGTKHDSVDFLIATDYEMKKVNWSTPKEIVGSTTVVISGFVLISVVLFLFDLFMQFFFTWINVIQKPTA